MGPLRRLIDTVRGWWTLADRIEQTTEKIRAATDDLEQAVQSAKGGSDA